MAKGTGFYPHSILLSALLLVSAFAVFPGRASTELPANLDQRAPE